MNQGLTPVELFWKFTVEQTVSLVALAAKKSAIGVLITTLVPMVAEQLLLSVTVKDMG